MVLVTLDVKTTFSFRIGFRLIWLAGTQQLQEPGFSMLTHEEPGIMQSGVGQVSESHGMEADLPRLGNIVPNAITIVIVSGLVFISFLSFL